MSVSCGRLRVVVFQHEHGGVSAAGRDVEQPPGLHVKAGGQAMG
ncbi:MAG: hypothetical protein ACLP8S_21680 [Solirubrobacteraceae bacterium]